MSPHFRARRCSVKLFHQSRFTTTVEQYLILKSLLVTILTQHTSLASNLTHKTIQISISDISVKIVRVLTDQELYLRVRYESVSQAGTNIYQRFVWLQVPWRKFISVKVSHFDVSASCEDASATSVVVYIKTSAGYVHLRPCSHDVSFTQSDVFRRPRYMNRVITFHSERNRECLEFDLTSQTASFGVTFAISALYQSRRHNLVVTYQTKTSGTVIPYGFDGFTDYAVGMGAWARLNTPPKHSVMVSFPHFDIMASDWCVLGNVALYRKMWTWSHCGHFKFPPEVHEGKISYVFNSKINSKGHSGFKIWFSFHGPSEVPDKLMTTSVNTAVFNCSVNFFNKFKQHLECNLDTECVHAEDEARCLFSNGTCEPGFLNAGSKCYKYISLGYKRMTWYDVSAVCLNQGLRLASLTTLKEERAFRDNILQFAFTANHLFFGLRTSDPALPAMYREVWQWSSDVMAYSVNIDEEFLFKPSCATFNRLPKDKMSVKMCGAYLSMHYMFCETETSVLFNKSGKISLTPVITGSTFGVKRSSRFISCSGHETHDFLSCDYLSRCGAELRVTSCVTNASVNSGMTERRTVTFVCDSQTQTIHYTQVCDHHTQCFDSSDETFCIHQTCKEKTCLNSQCVTAAQWCDGMAHCTDGSDEACPQFVTSSNKPSSPSFSGFYVVLFDGHGEYKYVPQGDEFSVCPQTHFLCDNRELCLPVYLRCNGVLDCLDRKDENNCDDVICLGYYRCHGSAICVHSDHLCDGVFQCPQQDDELLCELVCPDNCLCQGLAFVCSRLFPVQNHSNLRYLDASQSGLRPDLLFHIHYLVRLVLSSCGLQTLPMLTFPNMMFLDLSNNTLTNVDMHVFFQLFNLNYLNLARNPIVNLAADETNTLLKRVYWLDFSHTALGCFDSNRLSIVRNLKWLNISYSKLHAISSIGFGPLTQIESLDMRGTELREYPVKMLQSLSSLKVMYSHVYKLCCKDVLPDQFSIRNCHTSPDEIASCKDLLRSEIYRMFLWISCCFALIGNVGSFAAKVYMQRGKPLNSFNVFIGNLNVADFFMGLYLAVIGSADQVYKGTYLWHDEAWKTGTGCQVAGFFSFLSCEMSVFIICFITLDRFLVMRFPFSQLHFRKKSAGVLCGLSWLTGVALATMPLLPMTSDWKFYSQTGICIPLPVTKKKFKGYFYSFGILIVFNFFLFVCIIVGQLFIYMSIRDNSLTTNKNSVREATVARRLLTIVVSDSLCWFPVGLLGLMASNGIPIPGEVSVALAIFALPLNSALNPFLYTFNLLMEKRRKASEQRLMKLLQSRISR